MPAQQHESENEERRPQVSCDQINPAGSPNLRLLVFERHQEIGGKGHRFPGHQEQKGRAGDEDHHHAGDENVEE